MSPMPGLLKSLEKDSPAALTLQYFHGMEVTGYERSRDGRLLNITGALRAVSGARPSWGLLNTDIHI